MAGVKGVQIRGPSFGGISAGGGRGPLSYIQHYAEKPIKMPAVTTPKVPKPSVPRIGAPKVTMPKFAAAGGLGMPTMGAAGPAASLRPHMSKQVTPRIIPQRRDLVPAKRPIGMTSQDEGSGGLQ
jgi:hypothetical protein